MKLKQHYNPKRNRNGFDWIKAVSLPRSELKDSLRIRSFASLPRETTMDDNIMDKHYNPFFKYCTITPGEHGSDTWLAARRQGVTASDLPILLGSASYKTPLELYRQKLEPVEQESKRQMEYGLYMEKLISEWAAEDLAADNVELVNWLLTSHLYPWLMATIDCTVFFKEQQGDSLVAKYYPLEIKTARYGSFESDEDMLPYLHQLQTQLLVTGSPKGYLAILPAGNVDKLIVKEIQADKAMQKQILEASKAFYDCLVNKKEPKALAEDLSKLHYNPDGGLYSPDASFLEMYKLYAAKKAELDAKQDGSKILEAELKDLKASMAQAMGESPKSLFFYNDKEVLINRKTINVREQVKPAFSYQRVDIKEL